MLKRERPLLHMRTFAAGRPSDPQNSPILGLTRAEIQIYDVSNIEQTYRVGPGMLSTFCASWLQSAGHSKVYPSPFIHCDWLSAIWDSGNEGGNAFTRRDSADPEFVCR